MFIQELPTSIFEKQQEFIRVMNANKDFTWWARALITEETKELEKAYTHNEGMEQIFKEFADLVYVVAGFYNTMPANGPALLLDHENEEIQSIFTDAVVIASEVSNKYRITPHLIEMAFNVVHDSNMSKLDENGEPIRREDGKILKGPNYKAPDMKPVVQAWQEFVAKAINAENVKQANEGNPDASTSD